MDLSTSGPATANSGSTSAPSASTNTKDCNEHHHSDIQLPLYRGQSVHADPDADVHRQRCQVRGEEAVSKIIHGNFGGKPAKPEPVNDAAVLKGLGLRRSEPVKDAAVS